MYELNVLLLCLNEPELTLNQYQYILNEPDLSLNQYQAGLNELLVQLQECLCLLKLFKVVRLLFNVVYIQFI